MATESISDRREHVRSVGVTAVAAFFGVGAALLSAYVTPTPDGIEQASSVATDTRTYAIVLAAIVIQFPLIDVSGIYGEDEFGAKHYLFITFITFSLWFVTWGILLTTSTS